MPQPRPTRHARYAASQQTPSVRAPIVAWRCGARLPPRVTHMTVDKLWIHICEPAVQGLCGHNLWITCGSPVDARPRRSVIHRSCASDPRHAHRPSTAEHRRELTFPQVSGLSATVIHISRGPMTKTNPSNAMRDHAPEGLQGLVDYARLVDRIRCVRSATWLYRLLRSAMSWRTFRSACMTVVWSRPPKAWPIFGRERSVSSRQRYIAI